MRLFPICLAALSLLACGRREAPAAGDEARPGGEAAVVQDEVAPKLASTVLLADDTLWGLGPEVRERTVAVSALSDDPRYSETVGQWPKELARVGPNPAEIVALEPKVVFIASFSDQAYRAALEEHFEVVVLESFTGFDDYRKNVRTIAGSAGDREAGEKLIEEFDQRLAGLEATRPEAREAWPTCLSWEGGYVAGKNTSFDDATEAAGCINLVAREGVEGHAAVDTEQLLAWQPDFLVVSCLGGEPDGCTRRRKQLADMPGVSQLSAVREGRVLTIEPATLSSVGAGMLDLVATLGEQLRKRGK